MCVEDISSAQIYYVCLLFSPLSFLVYSLLYLSPTAYFCLLICFLFAFLPVFYFLSLLVFYPIILSLLFSLCVCMCVCVCVCVGVHVHGLLKRSNLDVSIPLWSLQNLRTIRIKADVKSLKKIKTNCLC